MTTQLPSSGSISFEQIRNFYKASSGSVNLDELHKGESYVPNPASYNGSSYQTTLASNANSNVNTSGAIAFDDFHGGMKLVAPTCSAINPGSGTNYVTLNGDWTRTGSTVQRPWVGQRNSSTNLYHSGWSMNYQARDSSNTQYQSQLFFLSNQAYDYSGSASTFSRIQMNKTGQYRVYAGVSGNNAGVGGSLTISGAGVISGGLSSSTIGHNSGFNPVDIVFEANKNIDITTSGYAGNAFQFHIVTNCNAYTGFNSDYNGANNYMLTTYKN